MQPGRRRVAERCSWASNNGMCDITGPVVCRFARRRPHRPHHQFAARFLVRVLWIPCRRFCRCCLPPLLLAAAASTASPCIGKLLCCRVPSHLVRADVACRRPVGVAGAEKRCAWGAGLACVTCGYGRVRRDQKPQAGWVSSLRPSSAVLSTAAGAICPFLVAGIPESMGTPAKANPRGVEMMQERPHWARHWTQCFITAAK